MLRFFFFWAVSALLGQTHWWVKLRDMSEAQRRTLFLGSGKETRLK